MPCSSGVVSQHVLQAVSKHALQQGGSPGPHPGGGSLGGWAGGGLGGAGGACMAGETANAADGAHPTGMHPCLIILSLIDKHLLSEEPITSRTR